MMKMPGFEITTDNFVFLFPDALDAFKFDEDDKNSPHYHGASHAMKAVDIIVEFQNYYLFVEEKDFEREARKEEYSAGASTPGNELNKIKNVLKNDLIYKYRDSFLYRYAEEKTDKPVVYICLIDTKNLENSQFSDELKREMPIFEKEKHRPKSWKRDFIRSCHVVNLQLWNATFGKKWPARRIDGHQTP